MKTLFALVAICLATSAWAMTTSEFTSFYQRTQESQFGKTLWGTVELELSNGAPGDYLVNLLKKMENHLLEDIRKANKTHESFVAKITHDIATLAAEIKLNARNIIASKKIISQSQQKLSWDRQQLEQDKKHKADAQSTLDKARSVRKAEKKIYDQKIKELNDALLVLHQGKSVLETGLQNKGASFVQVAATFDNFLNRMKYEVNQESYAGRGYVSVIARVAELISLPKIQANPEMVAKIVKMIQDIIDEVENAKTVETRIETERRNNYHQVRDLCKKTISDLNANIQKLENNIRNLEQIITYNTNRISECTRTIQVKSRQKTKLKKEKRIEEASYKKAHARRQADYDLAREASNLIVQNIDEFRKIVLQNAKSHVSGEFKGNTAEKVAHEKAHKSDVLGQALHKVHTTVHGEEVISEREARFGKKKKL